MHIKNLKLNNYIWAISSFLVIIMPFIVSVSRLKIIGKSLALGIVALGVDLSWGYTGLLSLGQGIFFTLGGYAIAMYLQLNSSDGLPNFFSLYDVERLPFFWEPFKSAYFTFFAIWLIPALLSCLLGFLVFRNRIKGVYFSILTQAALLVFFNGINSQQKLINGTNGLPTPNTKLFGYLVGDPSTQKFFFYISAILLLLSYLFCKWLVSKRFGRILQAIRDDEARVRFSGYNPVVYKTIIFTIAGILAGISGALFTVQADLISPQYLLPPFSIEMVIWVAVGGRGTLVGAVFGAFFVRLFASLVSSAVPGAWLFIQGGLFILVVTVLPQGIVGWTNEGGPKLLLIDICLKLEQLEKNFKLLPSPLKNLINFLVKKGLMLTKKSETYPRLDQIGKEEVEL
mgnify:FL=1